MNLKSLVISSFICIAAQPTLAVAEQKRTRLYGPLETVINCDIKSPSEFSFRVEANFSNAQASNDDVEITQDSRLPKSCQADKINRFEDISPRYYTQTIAPLYLASSAQLRRAFQYMNNTYPLLKDHKETVETIFGDIQCLSEYYTFTVQGGFIYKSDFPEATRYQDTLGVMTPAMIWMLIDRDDGDQMAFLIDNGKKTTVNNSIVSIGKLMEITGRKFKINSTDPDMVNVKYKTVWPCAKA